MTHDFAVPAVSATACAKAILIGEHSVLYGYPAIAVALPNVRLQVSLPPLLPQHLKPQTAAGAGLTLWENHWHVFVKQQPTVLSQAQRMLLTQALALCVKSVSYDLNQLIPGPVVVQSDIPVGSGLGGSAALSVALTRAVFQWTGVPYSPPMLWELSNRLDALFHGGQASGIDTAAVVFGGIVALTKGHIPRQLKFKQPFWLVCVDSGVHKKTSQMTDAVKQRVQNNLQDEHILRRLGNRASKVLAHFDQMPIEELGVWMSEAHADLAALGVSCEPLDRITQQLPSLGAKLTGSGGGGFVIGVFKHQPEGVEQLFPDHNVFVVPVGELGQG